MEPSGETVSQLVIARCFSIDQARRETGEGEAITKDHPRVRQIEYWSLGVLDRILLVDRLITEFQRSPEPSRPVLRTIYPSFDSGSRSAMWETPEWWHSLEKLWGISGHSHSGFLADD